MQQTPAPTYEIRTLGCQMNAHDSERMAGQLEQAGYVRSADGALADVVVLNTCAVRENAADRLYGTLGLLRRSKKAHPQMQIAVAGCLAQKDRHQIVERAPWVDAVLGTHNVGSLISLLENAKSSGEPAIEIADTLQVFASTLPTRRAQIASAWVSISVGCNNTCTFCIVPQLRGRERDRKPGEILAEVEQLVTEGVLEVTLLGQNVNTYGVDLGERGAFAGLLRAVGQVPGLERVRFTSPHPGGFTEDVIEVMANTATVMPSLHMPLQSGSDRVLRAMQRSYRTERFLRILGDVRKSVPNAAITTDIIVGFPGETEEDFEQTLAVVAQANFASAFTFQYSPRPGTPGAQMENQVPAEVVTERYGRLVALTDELALRGNQEQIGQTVEVLVVDGAGRKDAATARLTGRAADNRLVHLAPPDDGAAPRPGDLVQAEVTQAAPHYLIADSGSQGGTFVVRRTAAGDLWESQSGV